MFAALLPIIEEGIRVGAPAVVGLIDFYRANANEGDVATLNAMLATDEMQKAIILHELEVTAPKPEPAA